MVDVDALRKQFKEEKKSKSNFSSKQTDSPTNGSHNNISKDTEPLLEEINQIKPSEYNSQSDIMHDQNLSNIEGCEVNGSHDIESLKKSAQAGSHRAMMNLYHALSTSHKQNDEARYWLYRAAREGSEEAKILIEEASRSFSG